ncbi:hypothetical protein CABS01_15068 [Colletotrichum abscissum]|uniref:uncharacterized protein n=1 Tax=Colletotrichum abscissum TaxID=1671311 RepID=UPI0027D6E6E4|nr:uncharacterized protein CABS01_15068 [Colletotrichum abscissum]KAK1477371.1 hypothetical protein CABS01_15068 [Colletotrichum abscissum]
MLWVGPRSSFFFAKNSIQIPQRRRDGRRPLHPPLTAVPSHDPQPRTQKRGGLLTNNPGSKSHTETGVPGTGQRYGGRMSFPPALPSPPCDGDMPCRVVDEGVKRAQSASLSTPGTRGNVILGFDRSQ